MIRWRKEYFKELINVENAREEEMDGGPRVFGEERAISESEVRNALERKGNGSR